MFTKKKFYLQIITLIIISLYSQIKCQEEYKIVDCSEGFKAIISKNNCPTLMTCTNDLLKINSYSCAYKNIFATPSKCKTGLECWNGECVSSQDLIYDNCPSFISCPLNAEIKCPDNTCVENKEDCPDYVECPSFNPIRCGNGDCRKSLSDCPSFVHCPNSIFHFFFNYFFFIQTLSVIIRFFIIKDIIIIYIFILESFNKNKSN